MSKIKKETRKEIQERLTEALGFPVTAKQVRYWQSKGYPLDDIEALKACLANQERKPSGMEPDLPQSENSGDSGDSDIEELIRELQTTNDYDAARRLKTQIDGLRSAFQLREAIGSYIPANDVDEAFIRIGTVFRAAVMRFEADLPPMLEGLPPEKMQKLIRQKADEVLTLLADECRKGCQED